MICNLVAVRRRRGRHTPCWTRRPVVPFQHSACRERDAIRPLERGVRRPLRAKDDLRRVDRCAIARPAGVAFDKRSQLDRWRTSPVGPPMPTSPQAAQHVSSTRRLPRRRRPWRHRAGPNDPAGPRGALSRRSPEVKPGYGGALLRGGGEPRSTARGLPHRPTATKTSTRQPPISSRRDHYRVTIRQLPFGTAMTGASTPAKICAAPSETRETDRRWIALSVTPPWEGPAGKGCTGL